jgi:deoxyxylulose-5-phosphate synthase
MQLFGLHYCGIVDAYDLEWFFVMLEECKSLDINNFLHNISHM